MKTIHKWHGIEPIHMGDKSLAKAALHVLLINTELDVGLGLCLQTLGKRIKGRFVAHQYTALESVNVFKNGEQIISRPVGIPVNHSL